MQQLKETAEQRRLEEAREQKVPWKKWGPYLSERQWGTVSCLDPKKALELGRVAAFLRQQQA